MFNLEGTTLLATGGTRGIGQEMVLALADAGADVILLQVSTSFEGIFKIFYAMTDSVQRNIDETNTQKIVQDLGRQCSVIACDISSRDSIEQAMSLVINQNKIDILLNAAGMMRRMPAENYDFQSYDTVIQTNLSAAFAICKTVGSYWLKNHLEGTIINVASLASFQGGINMAAYSASKGGLLQMSKALSNEWAGRGIRVNCVAPG